MKKMIGIISVFVLTFLFGITAFAADELTVNTTSNTTFAYSGTIDGENVFAVLVQVVDANGSVVVVDSASVTDHNFSGTITDLVAGAGYTLRVANYDGGSWIEEAFVMPNQSVTPPSSDNQDTPGTQEPPADPATSDTEDEADTDNSENTDNTDNTGNVANTESTAVTTVAPATSAATGKQNASGTTGSEAAAENIRVDTVVGENATATTMNTSKAELMEAPGILTEEEKARIENGEEAKIWLEVKEATDIPDEDKARIEDKVKEVIGDGIQPFYIDLTLWKQVGDDGASSVPTPGVKISLTITIPASLRNADATKTRRYSIVRLHDGVAEVLEGVLDEAWNFTCETEYFSTYAIIYEDLDASADNSVDTDSDAVSDTGADTKSDAVLGAVTDTDADTGSVAVSGTVLDTVSAEKDGFNPIILISLIAIGIIAVIAAILLKRSLKTKKH